MTKYNLVILERAASEFEDACLYYNDQLSGLQSDTIKFKGISKKYSEDQMVRIAYMVGVDGNATLIKVLSPNGDKEIEEEAKRILSFFPPHKPCKCGNTPVPCNGGLNIRLYPKQK